MDEDVAIAELTEFEEKTGPFDPLREAPNLSRCNLLPHQWWNRVGGDALPKIARRVLSLTCSASSCERNWSMYSFVHNKVRNRLATSKAETLVYIYANNKLEHEKRGHNAALFYEKYLVDGDTDEEKEEVYSSGDEDEARFRYLREEQRRVEVEERLRGNRWAGLNRAPVSPPRRQYRNTYMGDDDGISSPEVELRHEAEDTHVSAWDAFPVINPDPTRATTPDDDNEGADIPIPEEVEPVIPPIAIPSSSGTQMNLRSAARITIENESEVEIPHV